MWLEAVSVLCATLPTVCAYCLRKALIADTSSACCLRSAMYESLVMWSTLSIFQPLVNACEFFRKVPNGFFVLVGHFPPPESHIRYKRCATEQ